MIKKAISIAAAVCVLSAVASTSICPAVSQIGYNPANGGSYTVPSGWAVLDKPACSDNTPIGWIETSWGALRVNPNRTQCTYAVKGYHPNSGCGALTIVRTTSSSDPWLMKNRFSGWIDNDSHGQYPHPWDSCQAGTATGSSRTTCTYPSS